MADRRWLSNATGSSKVGPPFASGSKRARHPLIERLRRFIVTTLVLRLDGRKCAVVLEHGPHDGGRRCKRVAQSVDEGRIEHGTGYTAGEPKRHVRQINPEEARRPLLTPAPKSRRSPGYGCGRISAG